MESKTLDMEKRPISGDGYLRAIMENLEEIVLLVDRDGKITRMNQAAQQAVELTHSDPGELEYYQILFGCENPFDTSNLSSPARTVFKTGSPARSSHDRHKGDRQHLYDITATPVFDEKGSIHEVIEIIKDVTAIKNAKKTQTSKTMLAKLVQSIPEALVTIHPNGLLDPCNDAIQTLFGYTRDEVRGRPFLDLIAAEDHPLISNVLMNTNQSEKGSECFELKGQNKNHATFPLEVSLSPWSLNGKRYFTAILRKVRSENRPEQNLGRDTEENELARQTRENAELRDRLDEQEGKDELLVLALHKHEELNNLMKQIELAKKEWEGTMDCVSDLIILTDSEGKIKRCNNAVIEFSNRAYHEVLGSDWKDILPEDDIEVGTILDHGMEFFYQPTNRWYVMKYYEFNQVTTNWNGIVITLHDSTEVKQASEELARKKKELEENKVKLQTALDKISSLIQQVAYEKGFSVRFTNPNLQKCYEIMDCKEEGCICYGQEAMRCWQEQGTYCREKLKSASEEDSEKCPECPVYQEATSDPIYKIGEYFNNMMQILESKNSELEEAYTELKGTQATILQQEKMASIGQLAAGVAHEINNPMGFISSNLRTLDKYILKLNDFILLQSRVIDEVQADSTEEVKQAKKKLKLEFILEDIGELIKESLDGADRVRKIVQNLKSFSRVDQAEYKDTDINECLDSTINIVWNEIKYKATINKDYSTLPPLKCYAQQLNQVFMNLLVNGAQSIEKQGEITIQTREEEGFIVVSISDTGCGIPEEKRGRIFEPFFTTKEVGKGTGLGLSITYDIIKKHEGEIFVESVVGTGTTFTLKLPLKKGNEDG